MRSRAVLVMTAMVALLCGPFAHAQAPAVGSPEALNRVYACAEITDSAARLACYDAAVGNLRTAQNEGEFAAIDREQAVQVEREAFGFSLPSLPRLAFPRRHPEARDGASEAPSVVSDQGIDALELTIERVVARGDGRATFIMTNGQRWEQIETERYSQVRPGGTVTIRRGAVGGFLMSVAAGGPAHRVRRVE